MPLGQRFTDSGWLIKWFLYWKTKQNKLSNQLINPLIAKDVLVINVHISIRNLNIAFCAADILFLESVYPTIHIFSKQIYFVRLNIFYFLDINTPTFLFSSSHIHVHTHIYMCVLPTFFQTHDWWSALSIPYTTYLLPFARGYSSATSLQNRILLTSHF